MEQDNSDKESDFSGGKKIQLKDPPVGILRSESWKTRRPSNEFRYLSQVEPTSPQPSVDRLSVTFADDSQKSNIPRVKSSPKMDKVHFPSITDGENTDEEEDYSITLTAIMQRKASSKRSRRKSTRRTSSPFSPDILPGGENERRRSSCYTTSSGDTAISIEENANPEVTQDQIFENIRLHKEVLSHVKMQPWPMRKKLRLVITAKNYIKRHEGALQERFAQSHSTKDMLARFNIYLIKKWQRAKREAANLSNWLIPWELRIKEIESHFGSVVASYFTFLRWLFWVNLVTSVILIAFVTVPELLTADQKAAGDRKLILKEDKYNATNFLTLWDFEGVLKYSPLFYGWYTNKDIKDKGYRLPLAYFMTGLAVYVYSFVATLRKMAENSRTSKLSEKEDECIFSWKVFTSWDYMIGNPETAANRVASIVMGFKEALLEEAEKKKNNKNWRIVLFRVFVNLTVFLLLIASAYAVVEVVRRSMEPEAKDNIWRMNEITIVMTLISTTFPIIFEVLGICEQYHPRKQLRLQLARIMMLNLLNLYSLIIALFGKITEMEKQSHDFKPNETIINGSNCFNSCINNNAFGVLTMLSSLSLISLKIFNQSDNSSKENGILPNKNDLLLNQSNFYPNGNNFYPNESNFLPNKSIFYPNESFYPTEDNFLRNESDFYPNERNFFKNESDFLSNINDLIINENIFLSNTTFLEINSSNTLFDVNSNENIFNQTLNEFNNLTFSNDSILNLFDDQFNFNNISYESINLINSSNINFSTNTINFPTFNISPKENITELETFFTEENPLLNSTIYRNKFIETNHKNVSINTIINCTILCKNTTFNLTNHIGLYLENLTYANRTKLRSLCWETMFGQELVKLTVMDLLMTIISTLAMDFFRGVFVRVMNKCWCWDLEKTFPQYGDFKVAENILHLVNNQGMVWMGMFFSPGIVLLNVIKLYLMVYFRSWIVLTCNVPHKVVFRASRSNNFYYALLLSMLFLCVLPVGYAIVWIHPSFHCGPFSNYTQIFHIFTKTLKSLLPKSFHRILDYIASPGIVIPLLVLLILIIYYLISLTDALREANNDLKVQLRRERTEERRKMFQIVDRRRRIGSGSGSGELGGNPFGRWRKLLNALPSGKSFEETPKLEGEENVQEQQLQHKQKEEKSKDFFSKFIKKALRKPVSEDEDGTDISQHESLPEDLTSSSVKEVKPQVPSKNSFKQDIKDAKDVQDVGFKNIVKTTISRKLSDSLKRKPDVFTKNSDFSRKNSDDPRKNYDVKKLESSPKGSSLENRRNFNLKNIRQDSIASNWSDNIPVITISKTESLENVLDIKEKDNGERKNEEKLKEFREIRDLKKFDESVSKNEDKNDESSKYKDENDEKDEKDEQNEKDMKDDNKPEIITINSDTKTESSTDYKELVL